MSEPKFGLMVVLTRCDSIQGKLKARTETTFFEDIDEGSAYVAKNKNWVTHTHKIRMVPKTVPKKKTWYAEVIDFLLEVLHISTTK